MASKQNLRHTRTALFLALAATSAGCVGSLKNPDRFRDGSGDGAGDGGKTNGCRLSIDVERDIFGPRCATSGCHNSMARQSGMDLTPPMVFPRLMGRTSTRCMMRPWVNPAAPNDSLLVQVLTAQSPCSIARMPLAMSPLSDDEIQCVAAWVASQGGGTGGGDGGTDMDATSGTDATSGMDAPPPPPDTARPETAAGMAFLENGGTVVMEAENADENMMRGGVSWTRSTANAGFSGAAAMVASPNMMVNHNTGYMTMAPQLRFRVDFRTTGTYYIWGRGFGATTEDDSFHAGVDNMAPMSASRIGPYFDMATPPAWTWVGGTLDMTRAQINIATAGVHTIEIWMREDGFELDKILLTTDMAMMPSGAGPAQSMRGAPR